MITVRIPTDKNFNYKECKKLFREYKHLINDNQCFRDIVNHTFFYSFFDENNNHIGCIYYYVRDDKLFVNAFAYRHTHKINLECLKKSFEWFNCDIYAETQHKTAILCLYRCGFKKVSNNLYKYER